MWAFRFTDLEGKRAQMEFARAGDRDGASGDVLTLSSAREKARDYKVALNARASIRASRSGPPLRAARRSRSLPRSSILIGAKGCPKRS
ncbi:hypothetical protein CQ13_11905 [Bradyrhizobium retamae]|uniref:Uncharacterized protein n=1 Tax=Bradyrhizobium retamae TaxID=1300035 RepID=A0A0R3MC07_9BRAD|nr:hypothetical protein CQ13_11905 [Bradyrhizobium retamae]